MYSSTKLPSLSASSARLRELHRPVPRYLTAQDSNPNNRSRDVEEVKKSVQQIQKDVTCEYPCSYMGFTRRVSEWS